MKDDLMAGDESMNVMLDNAGDVATIPDDFYMDYAVLATKWLVEPFGGFDPLTEDGGHPLEKSRILAMIVKEKLKRVELAYDLYLKAGGDGDLRHEVMVIENYIPTEEQGVIRRYFVFKEENNGNTFRIEDRMCLAFLGRIFLGRE